MFILQVHTDDGIVGLGETARNIAYPAVKSAADLLLGQDPMAMNLQELTELSGSPAYSGFEIALCDLVGKALGVPVYKLLGGAYRDRVAVSWWTGTRTSEDLAGIAQAAWDKGFWALKYKCRYGEPHDEQVMAVTRQAPGMKLIVDFNTDLRFPIDAAKMAAKVESYENIMVWEDPLPHWDWSWYAALRQRVRIPIAAHLGQATDVLNAIKANAVDYLNLGGGMFHFVRLATIAEAAGIPCWHGAGLELGIAAMSHIHACAAAKGCTIPSDTLGNLLREDDLVVQPMQVQDGYATVPQMPGLGVELDVDALKRYSAQG